MTGEPEDAEASVDLTMAITELRRGLARAHVEAKADGGPVLVGEAEIDLAFHFAWVRDADGVSKPQPVVDCAGSTDKTNSAVHRVRIRLMLPAAFHHGAVPERPFAPGAVAPEPGDARTSSLPDDWSADPAPTLLDPFALPGAAPAQEPLPARIEPPVPWDIHQGRRR